eukprot:TRINITY_DN5731_c0_g1_i7.p1 TRINITY_DN5731_c0_g1~~TRINITY_DN5731_c0_g1_i7.p1  ORF type:complete len:195 (-),score=14.60 TRINITY_DN5731_c0_g1_i7:192-776(-)
MHHTIHKQHANILIMSAEIFPSRFNNLEPLLEKTVIEVTTKDLIRFEGVLKSINPRTRTLVLRNVKVFDTERGRGNLRKSFNLDKVKDEIIFTKKEIKSMNLVIVEGKRTGGSALATKDKVDFADIRIDDLELVRVFSGAPERRQNRYHPTNQLIGRDDGNRDMFDEDNSERERRRSRVEGKFRGSRFYRRWYL